MACSSNCGASYPTGSGQTYSEQLPDYAQAAANAAIGRGWIAGAEYEAAVQERAVQRSSVSRHEGGGLWSEAGSALATAISAVAAPISIAWQERNLVNSEYANGCTHAVSNAYTSGDFQGEAALGSIAVFSATWEIPLLDGVTGASAIIANSLTVVVNCGAGAAGAE